MLKTAHLIEPYSGFPCTVRKAVEHIGITEVAVVSSIGDLDNGSKGPNEPYCVIFSNARVGSTRKAF